MMCTICTYNVDSFIKLLPRDVINLLAEVVDPLTLREWWHIREFWVSFELVLRSEYYDSLDYLDYMACRYALVNGMTEMTIQLYSLLDSQRKDQVVEYIINQHHPDAVTKIILEIAHDADYDPDTHSLNINTCVNVIRKHEIEITVSKHGIISNDTTTDIIIPRDHTILELILQDDQRGYASRVCSCKWLYSMTAGNMGYRAIRCNNCDEHYANRDEITEIPGIYYEFIFSYNDIFVNKIVNKYDLNHGTNISQVVKQIIREQHPADDLDE
jgi:hypothetical protein